MNDASRGDCEIITFDGQYRMNFDVKEMYNEDIV